MANLSIINVFMILQKPHIWEKSGSLVMAENAWKESIDILGVFLHGSSNQEGNI